MDYKSRPYKIGAISLLLVLLAFSIAWNSSYKPLLPGYHFFVFTPKKYKETLSQIEDKRKVLIPSPFEVKRSFFIKSLTQHVFPFWYGTTWGFYGSSTQPGSGSIACGYFVTTTLHQIGLNLNRVGLAQCASEKMIRSLVQKKYIWHFNGLLLDEFIKGLSAKGNGLYIIGLDNHTGFVYVKSKNNIRFIHSSGRFPFCVVDENAAESIVLKKSKYKVVGKISDDPALLDKWVKGTPIP
ncbi:MAG: hypothetical protein K9H61_03290 [Bacteroidia bacterium]|nr:hypothetical protein [Bacteroidia bacterium]MCF8427243.1 hypothetical protein [Bacteroidia bacterium]MCF8445997.1 hypothetical protein [Bacteroidia bacterium]